MLARKNSLYQGRAYQITSPSMAFKKTAAVLPEKTLSSENLFKMAFLGFFWKITSIYLHE
jgi:hypothetical protein